MSEPPQRTGATPSAAKASLLNWAAESDARARKTRSNIGVLAAGGGLAVLGGLAIARVILPRRRSGTPGSLVTTVGKGLVRFGVVARVGSWLLPHAISLMKHSANQNQKQSPDRGPVAAREAHSSRFIGASS